MVGEGTWESEPDVAEAWMWLLDQICHEVATIINQVHKHAPVIHKSWQLVQDAGVYTLTHTEEYVCMYIWKPAWST